MRILVTGAAGQLGSDAVAELEKRGIPVRGIDIEDLDIRDREACDVLIEEEVKKGLTGILHCAAYTAVDRAEEERELALAINGDGTRNLALAAKRHDLSFLYISTDYVFDGEGERPWEPEDERNPLNVYGKTKYRGELAVEELLTRYFIVRISWVFGLRGSNFVKTMLRLGAERDSLTVVDDQIGSPTYTPHLAVFLGDLLESEAYGVYHATNEGFCSWYEFAGEIFARAGMSTAVTPVSSEEFPTKARRPHNSRMSKERLKERGFRPLPSWQEALSEYLLLLAKEK